MRYLATIGGLILSGALWAQVPGSLGENQLKEIRKGYDTQDPTTKALTNIISNNKLEDISLNRETAGKNDHLFSYRVKVKGITNQKSSGRCWMFSGLNVLRPKVMEKYNLSSFEFSTNHLYFYDQLEKANLFLEQVIKTRHLDWNDDIGAALTGNKKVKGQSVSWLFRSPIGDGGVWNSFSNLAAKYGVMPKSIMPETYTSEHTRDMQRIIRTKLREDGLRLRDIKDENKCQKEKVKMLAEIYRILALNLGEPPTTFTWRYKDKDGKISPRKEYTPQSFYKEAIGLELEEYVMLMNDPSRPFYKLYEIAYDRNILEGRNWIYINLPAEDLKKYALASIKDNEAMYASCDVGKQLNRADGVLDPKNYDYESLFGINLGMNKAERIRTSESGSSHGMALVGVDVDETGKTVQWQFENSWGTTSGHNGYLSFSDQWFDEYMFRIVPNKKYIDEKVLKILDQKPIVLPPWDPMFQEDK